MKPETEKGKEKKEGWDKKWVYLIGASCILLGTIFAGLGVDLFLKKCCYPSSIIGLGIGLVMDGIILLRTYRYLLKHKKNSL
jgi:uncharacterized membrane-anchored protein